MAKKTTRDYISGAIGSGTLTKDEIVVKVMAVHACTRKAVTNALGRLIARRLVINTPGNSALFKLNAASEVFDTSTPAKDMDLTPDSTEHAERKRGALEEGLTEEQANEYANDATA